TESQRAQRLHRERQREKTNRERVRSTEQSRATMVGETRLFSVFLSLSLSSLRVLCPLCVLDCFLFCLFSFCLSLCCLCALCDSVVSPFSVLCVPNVLILRLEEDRQLLVDLQQPGTRYPHLAVVER